MEVEVKVKVKGEEKREKIEGCKVCLTQKDILPWFDGERKMKERLWVWVWNKEFMGLIELEEALKYFDYLRRIESNF